jgi:hypothetical protein
VTDAVITLCKAPRPFASKCYSSLRSLIHPLLLAHVEVNQDTRLLLTLTTRQNTRPLHFKSALGTTSMARDSKNVDLETPYYTAIELIDPEILDDTSVSSAVMVRPSSSLFLRLTFLPSPRRLASCASYSA